MNKEDALSAKGLTSKRKKEEASDSQNKMKDWKDHSSNTKSSKNSPKTLKRKLNFTPLVMPADKILMQIKYEPGLRWPKPMSSSSKKRDMKKYVASTKITVITPMSAVIWRNRLKNWSREGNSKSSSKETTSLD